jgi:cellulose synthase/poly-beta-1,6-N-acetylglucosamine synthase-like glycosyltransferase
LLDVKYVCEIDDTATISALQAQQLGPECEIVLTPDFGPRTKPKALQYALQGARGSLVAVYDAEDKPAPGQLLEACSAFAEADDRLGCVQAPLAIANLGTNWISGFSHWNTVACSVFSFPFWHACGCRSRSGLIKSFPALALEATGGWDPYNVTEDADLGLRLYAHGYYTGTLKAPPWKQHPPHSKYGHASEHAGSKAGPRLGW